MIKTFERSQTFPWFIYNVDTFGFDADLLAQEFFKKGYLKIYNTETEQVLDAMRALVQRIIDTSIEYQDESVKEPAKRLQIIINGNILEMYLKEAVEFKFTRNSDSKWLFNGSYEIGTDFTDKAGFGVEAKVYYSVDSMNSKILAANQGNKYIFHEALFVCCYLIKERRYQWLKCTNGLYDLYNNMYSGGTYLNAN